MLITIKFKDIETLKEALDMAKGCRIKSKIIWGNYRKSIIEEANLLLKEHGYVVYGFEINDDTRYVQFKLAFGDNQLANHTLDRTYPYCGFEFDENMVALALKQLAMSIK
jgi:hypothetical protein